LWDGRGPDERTDVDIVIEGNRIESIRPHRDRRQREEDEGDDETRFIDASTQTVIPGLWSRIPTSTSRASSTATAWAASGWRTA